MFGNGKNKMVKSGSFQGDVIGLGSAAGKYDFLGAAVYLLCNGLTGIFQNAFRRPAFAMNRGRIAADFHDPGHFRYHIGFYGGGGVMIQINHFIR